MLTDSINSFSNRHLEAIAEGLSPEQIQAGQLLQLERIADSLDKLLKILKAKEKQPVK